MFYIGIDEAGRGPVLGPMVLAGVLAEEKEFMKFKELGVKDSKMLTAKRREILFKKIKKLVFGYHIIEIYPQEIDGSIEKKINLNKIEALKAAEIINILIKKVPKARVIVDCPSPNRSAWHNYLIKQINNAKKISLSCEHKADVNHLIVGAASILAKVTRDDIVDKIRKKYDIKCGSGYPSDPVCKIFLQTPEAKELAKIGLIRKSWATWKNEIKRMGQKKLGEF